MRNANAASRHGEVGSAATTSRMSRLSLRRARSQQHEAHQQKGLAEDGEGDVDGAGAPGFRRAVMHDEAIGREADDA